MASRPADIPSLRARLKGQTLRIPDLRPLFSHWPTALSPNYHELTEIIEAELIDLVPNPKTRAKMHKINLPLFACLWWPTATMERLRTVIYYTLWLFLWDDDLDGADNNLSVLLKDVGVEELHHQALAYVRYHLGLSAADAEESLPPTSYTTIAVKATEVLKKDQNETQLEILMQELEFYMRCCLSEQTFLSSQTLPSVKAYWEGRLGSSAVSSYAALAEFMIGVDLPGYLREDERVKTMWLELNRNVSFINDMVSLRKEVNVSVYSLIPVTMKETGKGLPGIIAELVEGLKDSIRNFDRAAESLLDHVRSEWPDMQTDVERYVHVFRTMMTGSLYWSLASDRYGVTKFIQGDGSLVIPL